METIQVEAGAARPSGPWQSESPSRSAARTASCTCATRSPASGSRSARRGSRLCGVSSRGLVAPRRERSVALERQRVVQAGRRCATAYARTGVPAREGMRRRGAAQSGARRP